MSCPTSSAPEHARLLVITATLGESRWLQETVDSVRAHAGDSCVHVLAAPTRQLASLRSRFPHCVVTEDYGKEGGLYGALNRGLQIAMDWAWEGMTYLADDDTFLSGFSQVVATALNQVRAGEAALWRGEVVMVDENGTPLCRVPHTRRHGDIAALVAAGYNPLNQQSMIYSRAAVECAGRFKPDMKICADADHWLSALEHGALFHALPVRAAAFRVRRGQLSGQVEKHRAEFASLRERARRVHGSGPVWPAIARFRLSNLPLYWERYRRVGWVSGFELIRGK